MMQMMGSKKDLFVGEQTFDNALRELADKLEDTPDGWFSCPNGWLSKPKYDRKEQETSFIKEHADEATKKSWFGSNYTKRFFVLEIREQKMKYYKDSRMAIEKGIIDLSAVTAVIPSKVFDAPPNSLDLVTTEKHFTLAAESHQEIIRWAFAINLSRSSKQRAPAASPEKPAPAENRFFRFEVTFPVKGPLHLNVMGSMNRNSKNGHLVKHWMVVIGFERTEKGGPGIAEQCGKIMKKDFIEAVNGTDISTLTFDEAMELIARSDWPLTLRFLRDRRSSSMPSEIEGWYAILYPSLHRRRRRYVDLRGSELSFRKPAPGGAAMFHREAFFLLSFASYIQLLYDLNLPEDLQYVVRIVCKPDARINHLDDAGEPMGGSRVRELDIYFKKASIQEMWSSKLADSVQPAIRIEPLQVVQVYTTNMNTEEENAKPLAIWNEVTGRFAARIFFIEQGCLCWHRPATARTKARKVLLADPTSCKVVQVEAVHDANELSQFKYQIGLSIESWLDKLVIGLVDETECITWLGRLQETLAIAPKSRTPQVPSTITPGDRLKLTGRAPETQDEPLLRQSSGMDRRSDDDPYGAEIALEGYLFKKSDQSRTHLMKVWPYHKRWFVLVDTELLYFKTRLQAESGERPSGSIHIRNVFNVREAEDPSAPENSIEIETPNRTYLMVAEDEEWQSRWLEALGDVLEARKEALAENAEAEKHNVAARQEAIQKTVAHKGPLLRKVTNRLTGLGSWKPFYFVLTAGALRQYEKESDYLDEDIDCLDEFGLVAIRLVETTPDNSPKNADGHLFDIRCNVKKGGDSHGQKTFNFDAGSGENAVEWMKAICETTRCLKLVPKENGFPGYGSVESEDFAQEVRKESLMKRFQSFGVSSGPGGSHLPAGALSHVSPSHSTHSASTAHTPTSPSSADDNSNVPPPVPSVYARQVSLSTGIGRGRGFRGGRGGRG